MCHNSCDGHSVGTLILAWLVAQRLTPCNYNMKGYAAVEPVMKVNGSTSDGKIASLPLMTRSLILGHIGGMGAGMPGKAERGEQIGWQGRH